MFTKSQQAKAEHSEGSLLFGAAFGGVLVEVFGEEAEQGYEVVNMVCDIREDRANGQGRGCRRQVRAFQL